MLPMLKMEIREPIERCCGLICRIVKTLPGDYRPCSDFIEIQSALQEFERGACNSGKN
jgi:hypothetical protein